MIRFRYDKNPLGSGGFGRVHPASRVDDSGAVVDGDLAIKFLKPEWCQDQEALVRFGREVRLQQEALDHPNVLPVVGRNLSADPPYFVMPRATHSLREELGHGGIQDDSRMLVLFQAVLEGMAHAHERQVLHRDLKPENVLFVGGVPRVADFGRS
ncbi:MAG: protein kinase [Solirubrobacteraceae bacterium]